MKKLFNFYNYESKNDWYTYQNLFNILKAAGYYTTWISNQTCEALSGTSPSAFFSQLCDSKKFIDDIDDHRRKNEKYDEILLTFLDDALKKTNEKNFYVLHLARTHTHYNRRYSEAFKKFSADDEFNNKGFDSPSQRSMRANYDNAVLYNDFIVDSIIKRFEDKNAIVIYISEHGEEVYDNTDSLGHGDLTNLRKNVFEIPFIIWLSEKCRAENPELEKRISASVHRPYMTDDLIHTILDIMGIETEDFDPTRSIINEKFNASRPRKYRNFIYQDKEKGFSEI